MHVYEGIVVYRTYNWRGYYIVAVIGAGISGCYAANQLSLKGFDVSIFEKGRGSGGRTSSRRSQDYKFDHG